MDRIGTAKIMPAKRSNPKTMKKAGSLRKEPTPAEQKLWSYLRGGRIQGVKFRSNMHLEIMSLTFAR